MYKKSGRQFIIVSDVEPHLGTLPLSPSPDIPTTATFFSYVYSFCTQDLEGLMQLRVLCSHTFFHAELRRCLSLYGGILPGHQNRTTSDAIIKYFLGNISFHFLSSVTPSIGLNISQVWAFLVSLNTLKLFFKVAYQFTPFSALRMMAIFPYLNQLLTCPGRWGVKQPDLVEKLLSQEWKWQKKKGS